MSSEREMMHPPTARTLPGAKLWGGEADEALEKKIRDRPAESWANRMREMYEEGYAGAFADPAASGAFEATVAAAGGDLDGGRISRRYGLEGAGEGNLVAPFTYIQKLLGDTLPGPAQQRGSCVAHSTKNALLLLMCCDVVSGRPDEASGLVEGLPEVDPEGIRNGTLSTEAIYWMRGYDGDGWSCEAAADVALKQSGLWLRNNYPDLGIDLRKYSGSLEGKYGRRPPPSAILAAGAKHLVRNVTRLRTFEEVRDYLANGYSVSSCGSEGFSSTRDANGVSKRSGSWSHAMAAMAADDRDETKQIYGEPLVEIQNSWDEWNTGPRVIRGTSIQIPGGAFWSRWSDVKNRTWLAFSGAAGWAAKTLPPVDLGVG